MTPLQVTIATVATVKGLMIGAVLGAAALAMTNGRLPICRPDGRQEERDR
jgi:hypothetical protein